MSQMPKRTSVLHEKLIRLSRAVLASLSGAVTAWEEWFRDASS